MIPSKRTYLLLLLGSAIALSTSIIWNVQTSIVVTLLFDAIVLGLMIVDSLRAKHHRVHITRTLPPRLSIGRDNPVVLSITSQPVLLESDYMGAVTNVVQQQTRRALVVLITDIVDSTASAELLAAMGRLAPRYLPFCVTLGDRQVEEIAHTPTLDITSTYTRAVAIDLLAQRQLAFAKLKQKGVLVLDAPCDRLSEQIVDRYLQLKARNQL